MSIRINVEANNTLSTNFHTYAARLLERARVVTYMPLLIMLGVAATFTLTDSANRLNAQGAARTVAQDCASDLTRFCSTITPGEGRMVACLIAHSDKITPRCRLTAFLAGKGLAQNLAQLERLAFICGADINSLCHSVPPGGGRIYDCLRKNRARLLPRCVGALPKFESDFLRK